MLALALTGGEPRELIEKKSVSLFERASSLMKKENEIIFHQIHPYKIRLKTYTNFSEWQLQQEDQRQKR